MTKASLQDLEETEKFVQHRLSLLNQADRTETGEAGFARKGLLA